MARFNFIHYLFAVFAVLGMVAHALPAPSKPDMDTIAGMPAMPMKQHNTQHEADVDITPQADTEEEYMQDLKEAISLAAKAASSKATPTTAGPRPTPGVPTTVATTTAAAAEPSKPSASSKPSAQKPNSASSSPAAKSNPLSSIPLIGPLVGGLA